MYEIEGTVCRTEVLGGQIFVSVTMPDDLPVMLANRELTLVFQDPAEASKLPLGQPVKLTVSRLIET